MAIIGREKEIEEFRHLYDSGKADFVAIYGRLTEQTRSLLSCYLCVFNPKKSQ